MGEVKLKTILENIGLYLNLNEKLLNIKIKDYTFKSYYKR